MKTIEETMKFKKFSLFLNSKEFLVTAYKSASVYMFSECVCGATMREFESVEKYVSSEIGTI